MSRFSSALSATHPLPDIPLSAVELATFYPLHSVWPEYLLRFVRNEWTMAMVAKAQLHARDDLGQTEHTKRSNALRKAKKTAGNNKYSVTDFDSSQLPYSNYADLKPFVSTNHPAPWTSQQNHDHLCMYNPVRCMSPFTPPANVNASAAHPTLRMVSNGVVIFPSSDDAGPFTKTIIWATENGQLDAYTTKHVPTIVANPMNKLRDGTGLSVFPAEAHSHTWDQRCGDRLVALPRGW